jgi:3-oxoacyl-[acyl-carrier protein] reductase
MEDPTNQVIFLTGASRGIGRSIAISFAREGVAKMCLLARSLQDLQETALQCEQANPACKNNLLLCALDVCDTSAVETAVKQCAKQFGKVSIAVHNVGAHGIHSVLDASQDTMRRLIDLNLFSVMNVSRLLFPLMIETQKTQQTRTIFLSSALAQRFAMTPGWSSYTSAKYACDDDDHPPLISSFVCLSFFSSVRFVTL